MCVCLRVLPQPSLRHCPFHTFFNISPEPNNFPQPEYVLPAASRDANARVYRYHGKMVHSPLCGQPLPGPERTAAGLPRFQGYEGVPKSRENGTPWQGRVHSPVSEQPISNRKAISVQLRYCLWGKVPQIRDKAVHFPGFGTASVGLTGRLGAVAVLSAGESARNTLQILFRIAALVIDARNLIADKMFFEHLHIYGIAVWSNLLICCERIHNDI